MTVPSEQLDKEFYELAKDEAITDIEELNRVLERAVNLRAFMKADDRVEKVAKFVAEHFKETVLPLGLKAFLVAVDREACAKYKRALDKYLPPEWSEAIYYANPADAIDRPLVAEVQLSDDRETDVRKLFPKPSEQPKILIVTDKLLTGYDAPVLYAMYLDKPMRDHVLLQAIARVNRPFEDSEGVRTRVGLVVDFSNVLSNLKKALKFDSDDVSGVIEDLDVLLKDFLDKIAQAKTDYLDVALAGSDEQLEALVYKRLLDEDTRKAFYDTYRDIESLWEVLSPSAELRDHIESYKRLATLYATVRNAYVHQTAFLGDLAHKTRKLVEENAQQQGLGRLTKTVTFDVKTIETLATEAGSAEGKVINLVRQLAKDVDDQPELAPVLVPLKDRADGIIKRMQAGNVTGLAAMDLIAALAAEREAAEAAAKAAGVTTRAFAIAWGLRDNGPLTAAGFNVENLGREIDALVQRFPHAAANADEQRQLRMGLYKVLLVVPTAERVEIVDKIIMQMFGTA